MDVPDVRYARAGGVAIAYQVVGDGPVDLVYAPHLANLWSLWVSPRTEPFLRRLAEVVRLTVFNPRGTGLSDSAGDGFSCRFDGPARAIACARSIVDGAKTLDLEIRAGVHTGECELVGEKIAGIAVVTGARISAAAAPARCSSRARSRTSSPGPESSSRIAASTS